jgi:Zn-dependent protease with chaperone function
MTVAGGEPAGRPPRLNPFAFPSETTFRLALLVASVVGVSLFLSSWLYVSFEDKHHEIVRRLACQDEHAVDVRTAVDLDAVAAANRRFSDCLQAINRPRGLFMLGVVVCVLCLAVAIMLCIPAVKLRRRRLVPLTAEDSADVLAEVGRLAAVCGLRRPPEVVWNPLDPGVTGLAFGRPGRRYIALSGGLVVRHTTDPPAFRAVVLHELGHLRNRDVDATYFTVAIWYAFLAAAVAPFLPTLRHESAGTIAAIAWRLAALTALVYLSRNSVLRARESYADLRAAAAEPGGALRRVLLSIPDRPGGLRERLLAKHPPASVRAALLDSTDGLFSLGTLEAFGVGVAATVAYQEVTDVLGYVGLVRLEALSTWWISALVFAPLAVGVVGIGAWRGAFAALARGRRPAGGWRLGAALAAGLLAGQQLELSSAITAQDAVLNAADATNLVWAAVAIAAVAAFVAWLISAAGVWLPVAGRRSPVPALVAAFLAGSLVLTLGVGLFLYAHAARSLIHVETAATAADYDVVRSVVWPGPEAVYQFVEDPGIALLAHRPLVWLGVITLWLFPVAALAARRRVAAEPPSWGWLDAGGGPLRRPPVALRQAALAGAIGALAVLVSVLVLRLAVHSGIAASTRYRPEFPIALDVWTVSVALLAQGVVAGVTAARARNLAIPLALLAAFITALGGFVTATAYPSLASCVKPIAYRSAACGWSLDRSYAQFTFEKMVVEGALVALICAAAARAAVAGVRLRSPSRD